MSNNVIKFKDKKKLEKVLSDLMLCEKFIDNIITEMHPHRIFNPIGDLLYQAYDSRTHIRIHIKSITKQLEE